MIRSLSFVAASLLTIAASTASAATIVNLSASSTNPNAGPVTQANSGGAYTYNPVTLALGAGTYTVTLAGIAGGGLYDAYSVATPANGNYTEQFAGYSIGGTSTLIQPLSPTSRYSTAAAALAAYQAAGPVGTFTLTSLTNVSFYIEDAASAYFGDDTGGVSFAVTQVSNAVPEPATWGMMILGVGAVGGVMRRRRKTTARVSHAA